MSESRISFEDLYGEDRLASYNTILLWVNDVISGIYSEEEGRKVAVDLDKIYTLVANISQSPFPCNGGYHKASPFKKAAYIFVWLMAENPFPGDKRLAAIVGYSIVQSCLHGATFTNRIGNEVTLNNKIQVSDHFFTDLLEASGDIVPQTHFRTYCLLFESLAYAANPLASYEVLI